MKPLRARDERCLRTSIVTPRQRVVMASTWGLTRDTRGYVVRTHVRTFISDLNVQVHAHDSRSGPELQSACCFMRDRPLHTQLT